MFLEPRLRQNPMPAEPGLGARELATIVWRRKWYFVLCLTFTLGLGAAYFVRADRLYQVSARLLVEKQGLPLGGAPEQQEKEFLATQAEIIRSPAVVGKAAESIAWPSPMQPDESPTAKLLAALDAHPVMGTHVISVSYRSHNVPHAVDAVEEVIASYRGYLRQSEQDNYLETLRLLTQSEKDLRSDLQSLERHYRDLRKDSPVTGNGKNGSDVQLVLVQQLGQKLTETRNRRIELENQLQATRNWELARREALTATTPAHAEQVLTRASVENPLAQLAESSPVVSPVSTTERLATVTLLSEVMLPDGMDITQLQLQLSQAELREKELSERYGHRHAELRAVREQVNILRNRLQETIDAAPEILERQLSAIEANEQRLLELYSSEQAKAKEIDVYLLEEQQARDQIERVHLLHDSILTQLRQSELTSQAVAEGRSGVKVTVLETPVPPSQPLWPSPLVLGVVCTALGLVCASGLVVFSEYRQPTFPLRTATMPTDAELALTDSELGSTDEDPLETRSSRQSIH